MTKPSKASSILMSIDDLLETDPRSIIPKLLDSIPQEYSSPGPNKGRPLANDVDYQGDDDFDPYEDLEDIIFGDVSPTKLFIPSPNKRHGIVGQQALSLPCWFSPIPSDAGYEADDDYDPCDDLADDIFGYVSPSRYFLPLLSRVQAMKDNYEPKLPVTEDMGAYSGSSLDSSSDSEDDMETEEYAAANQFSSQSSSSDNEDDVQSKGYENFSDTLKETALAIRRTLIDLEVIETYDRLGGDEFGDALVEVRPKSLPDGPTLVAYKDAYGQITVPLEMGCNQHAAAIFRKIIDDRHEQDTDSMNQKQISCSNSWKINDDLDIFVLSSEIDSDSDFQSCDEEELMNLAEESNFRGHKRGRDELDSYSEDPMKTPANSRHKIQRLD